MNTYNPYSNYQTVCADYNVDKEKGICCYKGHHGVRRKRVDIRSVSCERTDRHESMVLITKQDEAPL